MSAKKIDPTDPSSAPTRVNTRYTRLARTSRSSSSKLQLRMCFKASIRRATSAGVPFRPRVALLGLPVLVAHYNRDLGTAPTQLRLTHVGTRERVWIEGGQPPIKMSYARLIARPKTIQ